MVGVINQLRWWMRLKGVIGALLRAQVEDDATDADEGIADDSSFDRPREPVQTHCLSAMVRATDVNASNEAQASFERVLGNGHGIQFAALHAMGTSEPITMKQAKAWSKIIGMTPEEYMSRKSRFVHYWHSPQAIEQRERMRKWAAYSVAYMSDQRFADRVVNAPTPGQRATTMKLATMVKPLDDWSPSAIAQIASNGKRSIAPAESVPTDDWSDEMIAAAAARARNRRSR